MPVGGGTEEQEAHPPALPPPPQPPRGETLEFSPLWFRERAAEASTALGG